jgi:hypothetical protein
MMARLSFVGKDDESKNTFMPTNARKRLAVIPKKAMKNVFDGDIFQGIDLDVSTSDKEVFVTRRINSET